MDQSDMQSNLITSNLCSLDCIGMSSDSTESFGSDLCLFLERKCIGKATSSAHMCSSLARKDLDRFGMIGKNVTCYNVDFKRNINEKLLGGNPTHRIARPRLLRLSTQPHVLLHSASCPTPEAKAVKSLGYHCTHKIGDAIHCLVLASPGHF